MSYEQMIENEQKKGFALLLPFRSVMFLLVFVIGAAVVEKKTEEITNWWSVVCSLVNVITILLILVLTRVNKTTYAKLIHFEKGKTGTKRTVYIVIGIVILGMSGMYLAGLLCYGKLPYAPASIIAPIPTWMAALNVLILPVTTALAEDGLYLGCGTGQMKGKAAAILIPAFFFALQHCFIPVIFDVRYMVYRFLSFLPLALVLCWFFHRKKEPLPILIGHAILDLATAVSILATSAVPGVYEKAFEMMG